MRVLGVLSFLAGGVLAYFMVVDRTSAIALDLVEVLPNQAWGGLMALGVLLIGVDVGRGMLNRAPDEGPKRRGPARSGDRKKSAAPASRDEVLRRARSFISGARVEVDLEGVPLTLVFEHAAPSAIKRTCERLGALLLEIPRPPRIRLRFVQCPEAGAPRHHQVSGALGIHLSRSEFKATHHMGDVDLMFHSPDPSWREIWG